MGAESGARAHDVVVVHEQESVPVLAGS